MRSCRTIRLTEGLQDSPDHQESPEERQTTTRRSRLPSECRQSCRSEHPSNLRAWGPVLVLSLAATDGVLQTADHVVLIAVSAGRRETSKAMKLLYTDISPVLRGSTTFRDHQEAVLFALLQVRRRRHTLSAGGNGHGQEDQGEN